MIKIIKEELNFDIKNELYKLAEGLINFINRDNILNIHGYKKLSRKESTKNINGVDSQFITYNFTLIYEELNDSINTNPEDEDDIFQLMHNRIKDYLEGEGFLLSSHRYYEDNNDNDVFIDKYEKHFICIF